MDPVPSCKPLSPFAAVPLALALVTGAGCGPSDERIEGWKKDPDGAEKLVAAVKDSSLAPARRGHAAAALVEIDRTVEMEAALAGFDVAERAAVAPYLVPRLAAWLDLPDAGRSGDARDALHALREQAPTEEARKSVDQVLLPALVKDVKAGRERAGRHLIKTILISIGAPTIPLLTPLLADPSVPFAIPVEVIDKVADNDAKAKAGAELTRRAKGLAEVPEPLWAALATLGGQEAADFLLAVVEKGTLPDAERAAQAIGKLRRTPGVGTALVRMAAAESTPEALRELLFQTAEKEASEDAVKALTALLGTTRDPALRKRVFAAVVKAGREKAILPALEALPLDVRWDPKALREDILAPLTALPGFESRRPFMRGMLSKSPIARLIGIWGIGHMGFSSDADRVAKLSKDTGSVRGLPPSDAVGTQATKVAAELRKKGP
jgi:hypothetical protein